MKEQKLVSMVARIDELEYLLRKEEITLLDFQIKSCTYKDFFKQPLTLGMFVPCDLEGNVLEEPRSYISFINGKYVPQTLLGDCLEYQQAKERVLFEGFTVEQSEYEGCYSLFHNGKYFDTYHFKEGGFVRRKDTNVEKLISNTSNELTLTPTACKQIGI